MKKHFGFKINYGTYESPNYGCDTTICGLTGEKPTSNTTNKWSEVTCKNCLKKKKQVENQRKFEEESIAAEKGRMASFFENH